MRKQLLHYPQFLFWKTRAPDKLKIAFQELLRNLEEQKIKKKNVLRHFYSLKRNDFSNSDVG